MQKFMKALGHASLALLLLASASRGARAQAPFIPDYAFGNQPGMIAVRGAKKWQAIPAGAAGQVLSSQGTGTVPGWITPSGTGNVNTDGNAVSGQIPYFSNGTTLKYVSPGGAALDQILNYSGSTPAGYLKRTGSGAYSTAAIPATDLPVFAAANVPAFTSDSSTCTIAAGTLQITCGTIYSAAHTFTAMQTFNGNLGAPTGITLAPTGSGNTQAALTQEATGQLIDFGVNYPQANSVGGVQYNNTIPGGFFRIDTRGASYPLFAVYFYNASGNLSVPFQLSTAGTLLLGQPLPVSSGGTGQTTGGGAALDAVDGFSGSTYGVIRRGGASSYSLVTESGLLDNVETLAGQTPAQGDILYRNGNNWVALKAGTSGQFLATNGGGANPSWASPSAPPAGSRVLINTLTANNSASLADTTSLTSSYSEYEIDIEALYPATTGATCTMTLYENGTLKTDTNYSWNLETSNTNNGPGHIASTAASAIPLDDQNNGAATTAAFANATGLNSWIDFSSPSTSKITLMSLRSEWWANSNGDVQTLGHAAYKVANPLTGFSVQCSSNISTGKIKVYGWN